MRTLIFLFATCLLVGCKLQKNVVASQSVTTDSLAHSEHHRTIATIDSVIRSSTFDFDTLIVSVERPSLVADAPEIIRLKAINGRVIDSRKLQRNQVEVYNDLDTVAYHQSVAETSTEHSATTRRYNPPDGTIMYVVAILAAAILIWLILRKR